MKVLLTGISGFIGHHLISALQDKGHYVVGVDKRPIPPNHSKPDYFIQTDVGDLGFRDLNGIDFIFHLAFSTNIPNSIRHPIETTEDNIDMTTHLLEYAKDAGVGGVLFPSTASLYSHNPTPWKEEMTPIPIEPYSWQKLACEYACGMYSRVYGLPTVVVRLFQVFGELQREDTSLAAFLKAKKEGKPITLTETTAQSTFKSGQRDFIYAGDVAKAMALLMDKKAEGIFNVCSGEITTMEDVAKALEAEVKWIEKRKYEVEKHLGDNSKLKSLGWSPTVNVLTWLKKQI
jgi:nucleoside-diphosphate-sugar epimerase